MPSLVLAPKRPGGRGVFNAGRWVGSIDDPGMVDGRYLRTPDNPGSREAHPWSISRGLGTSVQKFWTIEPGGKPEWDDPLPGKIRLLSGDAESAKDPCFAHVASPITDSGLVLAEADAGPKGVLVDAGGVSHCSRADGGVSHCILEDPDGANQVLATGLPPSLLVANGAMDVLELAASPKGFCSARGASPLTLTFGSIPSGDSPPLLKPSWSDVVLPKEARGPQLPSIIRLKSDVEVATSPVDFEITYHGKPVHPVKGRCAKLGQILPGYAVGAVDDVLTGRASVKSGFATEQPIDQSDEQPSDASPFKPLDKAPILKVVRFAPEILSAKASSCASHRKRMAPCSDICHPILSRRSNLGHKASEVAPVDVALYLASPPFSPPTDAHGEETVKDLSSSVDVSIVCQYEAPAVEVVPIKNGSSIRWKMKTTLENDKYTPRMHIIRWNL
ncbi:hypothetical protein Nepgr_003931 [Nepenthes gracilis]|uniref:Uncharacterized protein n=1 Tax=Nepenthes gracilis TaxID=150966 RepID=A0AAD3S0M5_NEPGR|nr:hypothetical protein Nepgr_003931 [Nepenthes gracilis]